MQVSRRRVQLLLASVTVLQLAAASAHAQSEIRDPWERANRKSYALAERMDRYLFGPLASTFGKTPGPVRQAIVNFASNLGEPLVFVNDMLQGHIGTAASTAGRFAINTTVGLGGLIDVAARGRIPHHDNGFGTTLGRWGVKPGPYLFLPLVGPSTVRDSFGTAVNFVINPLDYWHYNGDIAVGLTTGVVGGLSARYEAQPQLENIRNTSTDPYATLRSYYTQNREAEIHGTAEPGALPEFEEAPPAETPLSPSVEQPQPPGPVPPMPGAAGALPHPQPAPSPEPSPAPPAPTPQEPAGGSPATVPLIAPSA